MQPVLIPNDTNYTTQWDLFAPTPGLMGANLPGAWDISTGASNLVVAVLDTGQLNHNDLAGRFVQGYDMISDSRIGNDGNARDTDPSDPGDWITSAEAASGFFAGCQVRNSSWHGTHVAGTIGANGNNANGVTGINWQSKIQHVRVLGKCGGYSSDIADGIRWAAGLTVSGVPANATPARVINMSLGGSGTCSSTYSNAINAATSAGTVVVVAAGNSAANAANYSPASCANVITVASTGKAGNIAYYSNFGTTVEIAAPGGDKNADANDTILSTLNTGTTVPVADSYVKYQGTSMATPHVAGIVSLVLSVNPGLTPAQVTSLLQSTVTAFPAGSTCSTSTCGAGIINAAAAVAAAGTPPPPGAFAKSSPTNGAANQATSLSLSWGSSSGASSYEYCLDTTNNNACDGAWTSTGTATSASVSGLANSTTYYWQARAANVAGTTEADAGAWFSFSTQAAAPAPGAFNKTRPTNGQTGVGRRPTLRWGASSGATSYEYCVDTTNDNVCDGSWVNVGNVVSYRLPSQLPRGVTHYWQVRAVNANGTTDANGGTWWQFTTVN
jgi:serine protease